MIKLEIMIRTPMILLSAIFEFIRIILLALGARLIIAGDSTMVNNLATILLVRILIVSSFLFPALLMLAWFNTSYTHFLTLFVPLKIALIITDASSFFTVLTSTAQLIVSQANTVLAISLTILIAIDSFILFSVNREIKKRKKLQQETPIIETVELS